MSSPPWIGAVSSSSTKMKCNTKSSTETELISFEDKLLDIVWMRYFIECKGYDLDEYFVYQDNMSALSLEMNGLELSSKRTKHIKAKYFLIKDYYDSGEIDLDSAQLKKCGRSFSQNLCKDRNSETCKHSYRIAPKTTTMTLK
jgi:hypothetical protein